MIETIKHDTRTYDERFKDLDDRLNLLEKMHQMNGHTTEVETSEHTP